MNEADFESMLDAEIKKVFPNLDKSRIQHQRRITLRLGHGSVTIDSKDQLEKSGRLDLLLLLDTRPLALLELKRPAESLTEDDRDQAISYGRLLTPMPPLTIVTNGTDICFYKTFDKTEWTNGDPTGASIEILFRHAIECAAKDKDEAVRLLLGYSTDIWKHTFQDHTSRTLAAQTGDITDASKPLAKGFSISRIAASEVINLIKAKHPLIVVTGPPLVGKTNVLSQICSESTASGITPLLCQAFSAGSGVLDYIAEIFCKALFTTKSTDETLQWLLHGRKGQNTDILAVLLDGLLPHSSVDIASEITRLGELADKAGLTIVVAMDENTWEGLRKYPGRPTLTPLGSRAKVVIVDLLSDSEYHAFEDTVLKANHIHLQRGAGHSPEYRHPGLLRILFAQLQMSLRGTPDSHSDDGKVRVAVVPAIPHPTLPKAAWSIFLRDPIIRSDLEEFARTFVNSIPDARKSHQQFSFVYGTGVVELARAEAALGPAKLSRLLNTGFLRPSLGPDGRSYAQPRFPELFPAAAATFIADGVTSLLRKKSAKAAYRVLLEQTESLPQGDVAGTLVLLRISEYSADAANSLIQLMLADRPAISRIKKGTKAQVYVPEFGHINLTFDTDTSETWMSNVHPWLILSQIAAFPLGDDGGNRGSHLALFWKVGSFEDILRRERPLPLDRMATLCLHDIPSVGRIVCHSSGIVEPITQALADAFHSMPSEMPRLVDAAIAQNNICLAYRLHAAAVASVDSTDTQVSTIANVAIGKIGAYLRSAIQGIHPSSP